MHNELPTCPPACIFEVNEMRIFMEWPYYIAIINVYY